MLCCLSWATDMCHEGSGASEIDVYDAADTLSAKLHFECSSAKNPILLHCRHVESQCSCIQQEVRLTCFGEDTNI